MRKFRLSTIPLWVLSIILLSTSCTSNFTRKASSGADSTTHPEPSATLLSVTAPPTTFIPTPTTVATPVVLANPETQKTDPTQQLQDLQLVPDTLSLGTSSACPADSVAVSNGGGTANVTKSSATAAIRTPDAQSAVVTWSSLENSPRAVWISNKFRYGGQYYYLVVSTNVVWCLSLSPVDTYQTAIVAATQAASAKSTATVVQAQETAQATSREATAVAQREEADATAEAKRTANERDLLRHTCILVGDLPQASGVISIDFMPLLVDAKTPSAVLEFCTTYKASYGTRYVLAFDNNVLEEFRTEQREPVMCQFANQEWVVTLRSLFASATSPAIQQACGTLHSFMGPTSGPLHGPPPTKSD